MKVDLRTRLRYIWFIAKKGPNEFAYAFFRGRRRRRNEADLDSLSESDSLAISGFLDFTEAELDANSRLVERYESAPGPVEIRTIQWFVPFFGHAYLGGIYTLMRFADYFARVHGVENRFCVYDVVPERVVDVPKSIAAAFPALAGSEVVPAVLPGKDNLPFAHIKESDAAISTFWTSAYPLLRYTDTRAKFYFVQDFEPHFYAASSAWALAEQTYRFGFPGIVNTPGLSDAYREYGNSAVAFVPAVDRDRYRLPDERLPDEPVKIFFYGRPQSPRNAFGLGSAALREVKKRLGDRVDIVCAGENWVPGEFGLSDVLRNLGRLPNMDAVADLYRSCHVGLVLMLTKHPSYQPFEFMACGVATVTNENPSTSWFLRHDENCLLAPAAPTPIADRIVSLVEDKERRARLVAQGLQDIAGVEWDDQIERVWRTITKQEDGFEGPPPDARALPRFGGPHG